MNGWVHFHGESGDVVLRVSGPEREPASTLVVQFLEDHWSGLKDEERADVELVAGLFARELPEGL